jgi:trehalose 6-phosphate phosphatase
VKPLEVVRSRLHRAAIVLDFDGTLAAIAPTPEDARALDGADDVLASLVERALTVAVVTGRSSEQIRARLPVEGVRVIGSYGFEGAAPLIPDVVADVDRLASDEPGVRIEVKGSSVAVHVRNAPDPAAAGARIGAALGDLARRRGLRVLEGKRVWELVPAVAPGKGDAVRIIVDETGAEAILFAGDDVADLEAFTELGRLRAAGRATCAVAVLGAEAPVALERAADLTVDGPAGLLDALRSL